MPDEVAAMLAWKILIGPGRFFCTSTRLSRKHRFARAYALSEKESITETQRESLERHGDNETGRGESCKRRAKNDQEKHEEENLSFVVCDRDSIVDVSAIPSTGKKARPFYHFLCVGFGHPRAALDRSGSRHFCEIRPPRRSRLHRLGCDIGQCFARR